jgi:hypothetical protein
MSFCCEPWPTHTCIMSCNITSDSLQIVVMHAAKNKQLEGSQGRPSGTLQPDPGTNFPRATTAPIAPPFLSMRMPSSLFRLSAADCFHGRPLSAVTRCASLHVSKTPPPPKPQAEAQPNESASRRADQQPVSTSSAAHASTAAQACSDPAVTAVHQAARSKAAPHRPYLTRSFEAAFLATMRMRELWMSIGAQQVPDASAKDETIATASAGKEAPAVVAFRQGGCDPFAAQSMYIYKSSCAAWIHTW